MKNREGGHGVLDALLIPRTIARVVPHLAGGLVGFDKREFRVKSQEPSSSVDLQYVSPNGEEEFPGSVTVDVRYELTEDNRLRVLMRAVADRPTPINLAQHTYWNLAGHGKGGDVLDHRLVIHGWVWRRALWGEPEGVPADPESGCMSALVETMF